MVPTLLITLGAAACSKSPSKDTQASKETATDDDTQAKPTNQGEGIDGYLTNIKSVVLSPGANDTVLTVSAPADTIRAVKGSASEVKLKVFALDADILDQWYEIHYKTPALGQLLARGLVNSDGSFSLDVPPPRPAGVALVLAATDDPDLQSSLEKDFGGPAFAYYDLRTGEVFDGFVTIYNGLFWHATRDVELQNAVDPLQKCTVLKGEVLKDGPFEDEIAPPVTNEFLQFSRIPEHCAFTKRVVNDQSFFNILIPGIQNDWFTYEDLWPAGSRK